MASGGGPRRSPPERAPSLRSLSRLAAPARLAAIGAAVVVILRLAEIGLGLAPASATATPAGLYLHLVPTAVWCALFGLCWGIAAGLPYRWLRVAAWVTLLLAWPETAVGAWTAMSLGAGGGVLAIVSLVLAILWTVGWGMLLLHLAAAIRWPRLGTIASLTMAPAVVRVALAAVPVVTTAMGLASGALLFNFRSNAPAAVMNDVAVPVAALLYALAQMLFLQAIAQGREETGGVWKL